MILITTNHLYTNEHLVINIILALLMALTKLVFFIGLYRPYSY